MNETWMGLAADGNIESVDVAASWLGARDLERIDDDESYFSALWSNSYPDLLVQPFPEVARERLREVSHPDWDEALERALVRQARDRKAGKEPGRSLYPHQAMGLASWAANGRRGILAFATGSGKTFTALTAMREAIVDRREVVVLVVPDVTLFDQWFVEITEELADLNVNVLRVGAGHSRWRDSLGLWTEPGDRPRIVLATLQSASNDDFLSRLRSGPHLMLVADEVHRLGSPQRRFAMSDHYGGPRLGLSATPDRAGDPDGTARILDYFSGVLEPRYTLADAVRDGVLTRYFYRPHVVTLSSQEAMQWENETAQIKRMRARIGAGDTDDRLPGRLKQLLIRRARIVKGAAAKIPLAADVLRESYQPGQRWLVYCENVQQLEAVTAALSQVGITAFPYHSRMTADRRATLEWLDRRGGVVTSIRCLDEGVDIPSVTHALILASSKNPREFIQRRGRVLRRADGKALAYVHDAIVTPPRDPDDPGGRSWDPITSGELARAVEFAEHAENAAATSDLQVAAIDAGLDWRSALGEGVEDD
jgi:superfamily II DNA or RNA helicase